MTSTSLMIARELYRKIIPQLTELSGWCGSDYLNSHDRIEAEKAMKVMLKIYGRHLSIEMDRIARNVPDNMGIVDKNYASFTKGGEAV